MRFGSSLLAFCLASLGMTIAIPTVNYSNATVEKRQNYYYGEATYYDPSVGAGACGQTYSDSSQIVALSSALFSQSYCFTYITIWNVNDVDNSQGAMVVDMCPGCNKPADRGGPDGIDLSPELYALLGGTVFEGYFEAAYFFQ